MIVPHTPSLQKMLNQTFANVLQEANLRLVSLSALVFGEVSSDGFLPLIRAVGLQKSFWY
jgi:hypothetical protein